jgi:hypothetical protein
MIAYNILTLPETILFDCNSRDPITTSTPLQNGDIQTIYPGKIKAIDDAVKLLKQNNPRGGILPNALARKARIILALISNTLLYKDECFATTNWSKPRMIPRMKAIGVSIHRAPNANATIRLKRQRKDVRRRRRQIRT